MTVSYTHLDVYKRQQLTYAMVPNLVFLPFFRDPGLYLETLTALGMTDSAVEWMELDMPFFLVTARNPAR